MSDNSKVTFDEFMKNGWSYPINTGGAAMSTDAMIDPVTLKKYKLHVNDGELTMTEVTSE